MKNPNEERNRDRTFWRGMYMIAFVIGGVFPIASIIAAGVMTDDTLPRFHFNPGGDYQATLLVMFLVWSASTLVTVLGMSSAAWIVTSTGEKLGIDRSAGYLRGMFLMAFVTGGLVPLAGFIAVAVMSTYLSRFDMWLLLVAWGGMLAVCIAGLCCAIFLVRSAMMKLGRETDGDSAATEYRPPYIERAGQIH